MTETVAQRSTALLRTSEDSLFVRLRGLLPDRGVDVNADVLADLFPDDVDQEFGVLVTAARRVFTFVLYYGRRGDLRAQVDDAVIGEWTEITDYWQASPYQDSVREAFEVLAAT